MAFEQAHESLVSLSDRSAHSYPSMNVLLLTMLAALSRLLQADRECLLSNKSTLHGW